MAAVFSIGRVKPNKKIAFLKIGAPSGKKRFLEHKTLFHSSKEATEFLGDLIFEDEIYDDCVVLFFNRDEGVWEVV